MEFKAQLLQQSARVDWILEEYLPEESGHQKTIFEAMNYSVRAGGKRLRPILMEETYRLCGGEGKEIEPFMAAIEMIHTSSLVHDDLPAMDGDEYRRGKKTTWVVYGEDMGILAGDGLIHLMIEMSSCQALLVEDVDDIYVYGCIKDSETGEVLYEHTISAASH